MSMVASSDISPQKIPGERKLVTNDFHPVAVSGAFAGSESGLLAAWVALITPIRLTLDGGDAMPVVDTLPSRTFPSTAASRQLGMAAATTPPPAIPFNPRRRNKHDSTQLAIAARARH